MVLQYKRKIGGEYKRKIGGEYMNYSKENLEKALTDITNKRKSLREVAHTFHLPKSTLYDRLKGRLGKFGGQSAISSQEEKMFAESITKFRNGEGSRRCQFPEFVRN